MIWPEGSQDGRIAQVSVASALSWGPSDGGEIWQLPALSIQSTPTLSVIIIIQQTGIPKCLSESVYQNLNKAI